MVPQRRYEIRSRRRNGFGWLRTFWVSLSDKANSPRPNFGSSTHDRYYVQTTPGKKIAESEFMKVPDVSNVKKILA
jgi:hypothetical protein